MRITLIAVGTKMPKWVAEGFAEYAKRLPRDFALHLHEIALLNRTKNAEIEKLKMKEGELICAAVPKGDKIIALDVQGSLWSTEQLAKEIEQWRMEGSNYCLLVGGPDGLSEDCLRRADSTWSLSPLTLPHPLVRVIVAEQLYRAWSLVQNHPYHR